jgi:hypothetical protein
MADKANGQAGASAPKKGISKMEAVRRALSHLGGDAKPSEMQPWIKQQFGIQMSTDHISTYKGDIRRKQTGRAKGPAPTAGGTSSPGTPKPAVKKPAASKPAPKKPAAPRPQAQQAAARSNGPVKGAGAGRGISLEDIQAVKGLVGRIGAGQLRSLIDLLAR